MSTQETFTVFLEKVVNLNPDRVKKIETAKQVLTDFIRKHDDFKNLFIDSLPQGSYRQKTIIKPFGADGTFDIDLLIQLVPHSSWQPREYLSKLAAAFRESGIYEDITETAGKTRCVTINYEGDFHVDLVPAIRQPDGSYSICNKNTNQYERTDGDGYAIWFEGQNSIANNQLIPVIRLLKYLRDSREEFDTKSIILTTIAAMQVDPRGSNSDIPNTLTSILTAMSTFFDSHPLPPTINNPAMPGENFNRHWKDNTSEYKRLKAAINSYGLQAQAANRETRPEESVKLWAKLFGEKFQNTESSVSSGTSKRNEYAVPITPTRPWGY